MFLCKMMITKSNFLIKKKYLKPNNNTFIEILEYKNKHNILNNTFKDLYRNVYDFFFQVIFKVYK